MLFFSLHITLCCLLGRCVLLLFYITLCMCVSGSTPRTIAMPEWAGAVHFPLDDQDPFLCLL